MLGRTNVSCELFTHSGERLAETKWKLAYENQRNVFNSPPICDGQDILCRRGTVTTSVHPLTSNAAAATATTATAQQATSSFSHASTHLSSRPTSDSSAPWDVFGIPIAEFSSVGTGYDPSLSPALASAATFNSFSFSNSVGSGNEQSNQPGEPGIESHDMMDVGDLPETLFPVHDVLGLPLTIDLSHLGSNASTCSSSVDWR